MDSDGRKNPGRTGASAGTCGRSFRAAPAPGLDRGRSLSIPREPRDIGEALAEAVQQFLMKGRLGRPQPVEAPEPLLPHLHESCSAEIVEVMRGLCLRYFENGDDLTHAEFAIGQEMEDPKPRPVSEGAKHRVHAGGGACRFRAGSYTHVGECNSVPEDPQSEKSGRSVAGAHPRVGGASGAEAHFGHPTVARRDRVRGQTGSPGQRLTPKMCVTVRYTPAATNTAPVTGRTARSIFVSALNARPIP